MDTQNQWQRQSDNDAIESSKTKQAINAEELIENYLKSLSAKTRRRHTNELKIFSLYLTEENKITLPEDLSTNLAPWNILTRELVLDFVKWLRVKGYRQESITTCLYTIKTYCRMASEVSMLSKEEYEHIRSIRLDKNTQQVISELVTVATPLSKKKLTLLNLSEQQAKQLLHQPPTPQGARDELLMCLLLTQGFWPTEIATLQADAIDLATGELTVYRMLAREKQVHPLTEETRVSAQRYLSLCLPSTLLLMGSRKGGQLTGHMTDRAIHDRVRTLGARIGLPTLSPQDCHQYWEQLPRRQAFFEETSFPAQGASPLVSRRIKMHSDLFNRSAFEASLRQLGSSEQEITALISDFRLIVPLLMKSLGEKQFLDIVAQGNKDLQLSSQTQSWKKTVQYLVQWAEEEIRLYEPADKG